MRLMVELSAEHPTLPRAELDALAAMVGAHVAEVDLSLALVDAPDESARWFIERPGLAHAVSAHWFTTAATPRALVPLAASRSRGSASPCAGAGWKARTPSSP